jgi:hypothetical protein
MVVRAASDVKLKQQGIRMRISTLGTISVLAFTAACSPDIPNSAAGYGGASTLPAATPVTAQPLDGANSGASLAADTAAVLGTTSTGAPMSATMAGAANDTSTIQTAVVEEDGVVADASLSDEQNFDAVSDRETIASDKERIAENRAQYVMIQPTDLPPRPDGTGASIVAYALATTNEPGQPLYTRNGNTSKARFDNACARYAPDDKAQEAFLDNGGPETDRYGLDPDGDGFACYWDPRPFRAARGAAPQPVDTYEVIETPGESN